MTLGGFFKHSRKCRKQCFKDWNNNPDCVTTMETMRLANFWLSCDCGTGRNRFLFIILFVYYLILIFFW